MLHKIRDLTPLADCKDLEKLILPAHCRGKQLDPLRNHPSLKFLDYKDDTVQEKMFTADEFWKKYGGAAPVKK